MDGTTSMHITDDLDYYTDVYQTYIGLSEKKGSIEEWVETSFNETVVDKLRTTTGNVDELRVLGVGSGAGDKDCAMLEKLLPHFPRISNTVVEPSSAQIDLFKERVKENRGTLDGVTFDWIEETSDEYLKGTPKTKKFHLITGIHVIYYTADLKDTLLKLHGLLEEGGMLFIIVGSGVCASLAVSAMLNSTSHQHNVPVLLTEKDVRNALDQLQLTYTHDLVPRNVKGTALFDENSSEGRHLLDFYTHTKDFRKVAAENLRDVVIEFLKEPRLSVKENGDIFFFRHWVHITVNKNT